MAALTAGTILFNLKNNQYPDNGGAGRWFDTWGVAVEVNSTLDPEIFTFRQDLRSLVIKIKEYASNLDKESPKPQIILDYKKKWVLTVDVNDDNGDPNTHLGCKLFLNTKEVRTYLQKVVETKTMLYDVDIVKVY